MTNKMKRFFTAVMVLVLSISMFIIPAQAADYSPTVEIPVSVALSGTLPTTAETFYIELKADNAAYPMPQGAANGVYTLPLSGAASGKLAIEYSRLGVYTYTISQKKGGNSNCFYDGSVYEMTIAVTNAPGGGFQTNVAIYLKGSANAVKQDSVTFRNRYADPAKVDLSAIKTMDRKTPADKAFSFKLVDADGKLVERVYNVGQSVEFKTLNFDKAGTYVYEISEVTGLNYKISYDKSVYTVTIVVTQNAEGNYQAEVSYEKNDKEYEGTPRFANYTKDKKNPGTGDMFRMGLWVSLLVLSFAGLVVLVVFWLKKRKK